VIAAPGATKRALVPLAGATALAIHLYRSVWQCPIAYVLHVPCPTCGISRAARALVRLNADEAFHAHPLVFLVVPYLFALVLTEAYAFVLRGELGTFLARRAARVVGFGLCVALFVLWIARFFGALGGPVRVV
jgi:hypothetical protein